ncbi:MAG: hypothetical protein J6L81_03120 [Clostridia bacterium]|nr:hypothetical protein [Clostridia bacterium]
MIYKLDINYSEEEHRFLKEHNCEIVSEIKLSKTAFLDNEIPKRMIKYGGEYIAEIIDDETNTLMWAVLSKWKGVYRFTSYYDSLESMVRGI